MTENDKASSWPTVADRSLSAAIAVDHLVKVYKQTRAVDDISFSLPRGSITGLLGGNGAGKTTTIATIMGLVLPTSGRVQVLGHRMPEDSASVLGRMNFESPYVDMPMRLTVRQNLTVFGKLYAVKNLSDRIAELACDLDLTEFIDLRRSGQFPKSIADENCSRHFLLKQISRMRQNRCNSGSNIRAANYRCLSHANARDVRDHIQSPGRQNSDRDPGITNARAFLLRRCRYRKSERHRKNNDPGYRIPHRSLPAIPLQM
jgi:ABC-type glutathione transport system ATPase component